MFAEVITAIEQLIAPRPVTIVLVFYRLWVVYTFVVPVEVICSSEGLGHASAPQTEDLRVSRSGGARVMFSIIITMHGGEVTYTS